MILAVSNLRTGNSNSGSLAKGLNVSSNPATNINRQPASSQVAFGDDGNMPKSYTWHSSFDKISDSNRVISGKSIQEAFTNLYNTIQSDLNVMSISENAKESAHSKDGVFKSTFVQGREYDVKTEIPISKEKFVRATTAFANEYGLRPNLADKNSAIKHLIINKLGVAQPKGFFEKWFAVTEYSIHDGLLSETYRLMQKGLIVVK